MYNKQKVKTTIFEKLFSSVINGGIALIVSTPFFMYWGFSLYWKWSVVLSFFLYELVCYATSGHRDIGMMVVNSHWHNSPSFFRYLVYNIFYTLSFATIFIYLSVPLDLLLFNLIVIQLPSIIFTGTTFHGFLARLETIKH
ncbi:hypothetical protein C4565_02605 [Candidatus Parcubacteria bacterium]|nr:MAG: hypothetical protein C4565_02605 [Candidatus Parcubacteria bacterium]